METMTVEYSIIKEKGLYGINKKTESLDKHINYDNAHITEKRRISIEESLLEAKNGIVTRIHKANKRLS
jgi:predicted RNA-binding protein